MTTGREHLLHWIISLIEGLTQVWYRVGLAQGWTKFISDILPVLRFSTNVVTACISAISDDDCEKY